MMCSYYRPEEAIKYLSNAMSLREPQKKSLELFSLYLQAPAGQLLLKRLLKNNRGEAQTTEIKKQSIAYFASLGIAPGFSEFERAFPAYTFALATGVGKTRLMGAFVAYLYLVYNIQHFLLVAPNLTIYRKLVEDFGRENHAKYVFKGISEISVATTRVITKDNYANKNKTELFGNQIEINIFNVQQFAQRDMQEGKGIVKGSEIYGAKEDGTLASYFDYLKELDDLVVLLDETHHYHADAALGSLDLLDPLFALEMTATPYLGMEGRGANRRQIVMRNLLLNYNLGDAIRGKLVKDPWVGTEADFDYSSLPADDLATDARKLQLAAYFHERAKNGLKEYALANKLPVVKPVMLVVAKDTTHASALKNLLDSENFRGGEFIGKVIEVHSKQRGEESEETIEKLLSLENPDNPVEIVVHVNMLKEGWDVTNVYTIAPLRTSAADILTEQTLGRGLRLPYGKRTGHPIADRLVIVAHEQFARVVELAQNNTLIQGQVESINAEETKEIKILTEVKPVVLENTEMQIKANPQIMQAVEEQAKAEVEKISSVINSDPQIKAQKIADKTDEIVANLGKEIVQNAASGNSAETNNPFKEKLFAGQESPEISTGLFAITQSIAKEIKKRNIPIPRLMLTPHFAELEIKDFDLDTQRLSSIPTDRTILEEQLQKNYERDLFGEDVPGRRKTEQTRVSSFGTHSGQTPQNTIIAALLDFPLIDYSDTVQKPLLIKLANQAVANYRQKAIDENNLALMIESSVRTLATEIYEQFNEHKSYKTEGYLASTIAESKAYPLEHNITISQEKPPVALHSQIDSFSAKLVYNGFAKACHNLYRFDSSDEARFAYLLDNDENVINWLRPATNQFEGLYWRDAQGESNHRYEPDFLVELFDEIVMVEVKPGANINDFDVQAKKNTAEEYCKVISENVGKYGIIKPWHYIIVPTERITLSSTISGLLLNNDTVKESLF